MRSRRPNQKLTQRTGLLILRGACHLLGHDWRYTYTRTLGLRPFLAWEKVQECQQAKGGSFVMLRTRQAQRNKDLKRLIDKLAIALGHAIKRSNC